MTTYEKKRLSVEAIAVKSTIFSHNFRALFSQRRKRIAENDPYNTSEAL